MKKYKSVGDALSYIIESDGIDALLNSRRCINILNDLVPEQKKEIGLIRHVFDRDLTRILVNANSQSQSDRQQAINRLNDELVHTVQISEGASSDICGTFVKALKWDVTVPNDEVKRQLKEQAKQVRKEKRQTVGKWLLQRWKAILVILSCLTLFFLLYSPVRIMIDHWGKIHWKSSENQYIGRNYEEVLSSFEKMGFKNLQTTEIADIDVINSAEEYCVSKITINGTPFSELEEWYPKDEPVIIYYRILSENYCFEIPFSYTDIKGLDLKSAERKLKDVGLNTVSTEEHKDLRLGQRDLIGTVKYVFINDVFQFQKDDLVPHNAKVRIVYHGYNERYLVKAPQSSEDMQGMDYKELEQGLNKLGLNTILKATDDITNENESKYKVKTVAKVTIDGNSEFNKNDAIPLDSEVIVYYHTYSDKYRLYTPDSAANLKDQNYLDVIRILQDAGFSGIETNQLHDIKIDVFDLLNKEGKVESVSINGDTGFAQGAAYPRNAKVVISYHSK